MFIRIKSFKVLSNGQSNKVVAVSKADLVDSVLDGLEVKSLHVPYFLQLAVHHHCVWIVGDAELLCEVILFSLFGDQESNGFLDMLKGKALDLRISVSWLTAVKEDNNTSIFGRLAKCFISLFVEHSNVSLSRLL